MKHTAIAASAVTILVGAYSFVYACNESRSTQSAKAPKAVATVVATEAATSRAFEIDDKAGVCKTVQSMAPIAIEVDFPAEAFHMTRVIHIRGAAVDQAELASTPVQTVKRTAKFAATLGRALVTTVGAVFGTLVDAALQATASWV